MFFTFIHNVLCTIYTLNMYVHVHTWIYTCTCIGRSHGNVWRNFSCLSERQSHPLVGKISVESICIRWERAGRHSFERVCGLSGCRGQVQILRKTRSSWASRYRWPLRVERLSRHHWTLAACRVWPHFCLFHRAPWSLHAAGATPVEAAWRI